MSAKYIVFAGDKAARELAKQKPVFSLDIGDEHTDYYAGDEFVLPKNWQAVADEIELQPTNGTKFSYPWVQHEESGRAVLENKIGGDGQPVLDAHGNVVRQPVTETRFMILPVRLEGAPEPAPVKPAFTAAVEREMSKRK